MAPVEDDGSKNALEHVEVCGANASSSDAFDAVLAKKAQRRVDWRLMPSVCWLVIVAYLDRTAIGNARIEGMMKDLNMSGTDYSIALFVFFIPYILLDIPANMLMKRIRPSYWLCGLMFAWSLVTIGEGVTGNFAGLVVCRLLLGICETGFFPGCIYLMACYYTRRSLLKRISIFYAASILANAFGGLLAYAISHMNGAANLSGWRWIFIIEGLLTVVTAISLFWLTPDWPEQARFLPEDEKQAYLACLANDEYNLIEGGSTSHLLKSAVADPKVWFATVIYFTGSMAANSSGFFLPTILLELGWTDLKAQYMTIPVYLVACAVSITNGTLSDRLKHRYSFTMFPLGLLLVGYSIFLGRTSVSTDVQYMASFFMVAGAFSVINLAIGWLSNNTPGRRKKGISLAIMLGVGNTGGIMGANIFLENQAPAYTTGYAICVAFVLASMGSATLLLLYLWRENSAKRTGERDYLLIGRDAAQQAELGEKHPAFEFIY